MSDPRFASARDLFMELVELPESDRQVRLAEVRASDPELAAAVERLLAADDAAGEFLEDSAPAWLAGVAAANEPPCAQGVEVGPYRTLSLLGRGGMGEVFLAERTDGQFEQQVALKVLRRGLDSDEILRRFLRERQILARLTHPNLARLLDGGVSDDGRPWFALEHVAGVPITEWCRVRSAPLVERLQLVVACCDAVGAAHRSLIVHRDLKPSNILVTDGAQVKLLDFGIAKLLDESEADGARTRTELRLLTPDYAAPEQILGEPVTTATDVYALGLILHELLTGDLPHERGANSLASLIERARRDPPLRPSTLVRRADSARAARLLAGDLDTIVLKALRRDPGRRYASAAALADDLRRYLEGRPVQARPDTLTYRAGKFVRRHRLAVAAAVLVTASLLGGLAVATWQARRAAAEARRAERVIELLVGIFDAADPDQSGGRTLTAKEIVQEGLTRIERDLQGEPEVQADLFVALSRIRRSLGEFEGARALAERSVALHGGPDHPEAGDALTALGASLLSLGRFDQALPALEQAIDRLVRAEGPHSLAVARARSVYGNVLYLTGKVHEAEASERAVYAIHRERFGDDDVRTAEHLRNLGVLLVDLERFPEAEDAHRRALRVLEAKLGPDHPQVAFSLYCLGFVAQGQRKYAAAEPLFRRALAVREQVLGPAHPQVGETLHTLALALVAQDKLDEAEQAARRSEQIFRAIDENHFEVAKAIGARASIADRRGHYAESEQLLYDVMRRFDAALGAQHPFVWQTRSNIGVTIANQGRLAEAERWVREALAGLAKLEPRQPSYDTWIADRLAEMLCWRGSGAEAASLLQPVISYRLETFGADHPETAGARRNLAEALRINGDLARARETIDLALSVYSAQSPDSAEAGAAWFVSGKTARDAGELTRAEGELSEAVERLEAKLPSSDWRRDAARAALGSVQAALGQKAGRGVAAAARRALIEKLGATDPRVPREDLEPVLTRGQGPGRARQRTSAVAG